MNFRDTRATDENGSEFIFTVEMQRQLSEAGLPIEPASLTQLKTSQPASFHPRDDRPAQPPRDPAPAPRDEGYGSSRSRPEAESYSAPQQPAYEPPKQTQPETHKEESYYVDAVQIDPETGKYLGRLKWYDVGKGYGFILRGGGEEIFFHRSDSLVDPASLAEGQWVLYDVEPGRKGPEGKEVELYTGKID